jgi:hypothetical protein
MSRTIRIDRTAPTTSANPFALPRFERLVQPLVDCHVHGTDATSVIDVCGAPAADLLGSGHRQRLGQQFVPRPCGQQRGELVLAQLRRDRAAGDWCKSCPSLDANGWYNHPVYVGGR